MIFDESVIELSIRSEVAKYYDEEFSDTDDFSKDLHINSDDLSAIAISLEKKLGLKIDSKDYRSINNVESYASVLRKRLSVG